MVKDCSKAIDLQQTYIKALNRRADAYEKLEKLDEALKDHQKILELDRSQATSYHACMVSFHGIVSEKITSSCSMDRLDI